MQISALQSSRPPGTDIEGGKVSASATHNRNRSSHHETSRPLRSSPADRRWPCRLRRRRRNCFRIHCVSDCGGSGKWLRARASPPARLVRGVRGVRDSSLSSSISPPGAAGRASVLPWHDGSSPPTVERSSWRASCLEAPWSPFGFPRTLERLVPVTAKERHRTFQSSALEGPRRV